jgi:hypothetical protein
LSVSFKNTRRSAASRGITPTARYSLNRQERSVADAGGALPAGIIAELSAKAGQSPHICSGKILSGNRRFRLSGPIWVEAFANDGVFESNPDRLKTKVDLLGFVAVDLDFSSYQTAFLKRLAIACVALVLLILTSWLVGRGLLKRALQPLSELQRLFPRSPRQHGRDFSGYRAQRNPAIVTALRDTLLALQQREKHLWHLANHDSLTGLLSRHRLVSELDAEIASHEEKRTRSAVFFVDLDQFKYINDTCGHPAGDQLLRLLRSNCDPPFAPMMLLHGSGETSS